MAAENEGSKLIQCVDCGKDFVFTPGEQEFYRQNQFTDPKRCKDCRRAKKERRLAAEGR